MLKNLFTERYDFVLAFLCIITFGVLSIFLFVFDKIYYLFLDLVFLLTSVLYMYLRYKKKLNVKFNNGVPKVIVFNVLFMLLYATSLILLYIFNYSFLYSINISIIGLFILIEIYFYKVKNKYSILLQIILFSVNISLSKLLMYPGVYGIDPWWHQMFTLRIFNNYYLPLNFSYSNFPIFHLIISLSMKILNFSYRDTSILIISFFVTIIEIISVYCITKLCLNNVKIALFSSFLTIVGKYVVEFNTEMIPFSLGISFLLIAVFIFIKNINYDTNKYSVLLLGFFAVVVIITHTVASLILFVMFALIIISKIFVTYKIDIYLKNQILIVMFLFVFMVYYWALSFETFDILIRFIQSGVSLTNIIPNTNNPLYFKIPLYQQLIDNMGQFIYFPFSLLGILYMIKNRYKNYMSSLIYLGVVTMFIGYLLTFNSSYSLNERFFDVSQIFSSISLALSITILINVKNNKSYKMALGIFFIIPLVFFNTISPTVNLSYDPQSSPVNPRYALLASEMDAAHFVNEMSSSNILSDYYYSNCTSSSIFINLYDMNENRIHSIDYNLQTRSFPKNTDIIIIRNEIIKNPFLGQTGQLLKLNYDVRLILNRANNKIYDCGSVSFYK